MKLAPDEVARFCRELAALLHAGVSTAEGVYLMAQGAEKAESAFLMKLGALMDGGMYLSEAVEEIGIFPEHAVGMLFIGEKTGRLEETLDSLAEFYEARQRALSQIRNALIYPGITFVLMLAVIAVLLIQVLPVFEEVYASLGGGLEGIGAWMLEAGQRLKNGFPALMAAAALLCGAGVICFRCGSVRAKAKGWALMRFGDRTFFRRYNNAHFARALSMGFNSGIAAEEAMELSRKLLADSPGALRRCDRCLDLLRTGKGLAEALLETGFLTPAQCRLLTVGIRGGCAERMMKEIADRLTEEAADSLEGAVMKAEPALVLTAAGLVGAILLAVMLPLMEIMAFIG